MCKKIKFSILLMIVSLAAMAQGKLYFIPAIGYYSGTYKTVDSVNKKQDFIYTQSLLRKDFSIGVSVAYYNKKMELSLGIESGFYSSGFKHSEPKSWPNRVDSRESTSQGEVWVYYTNCKYKVANFNIKKNKKYQLTNSNKSYLLVSSFFPFAGAEIRRLGRTFVQDYVEYNSGIGTSQFGSISGSSYFHSYGRHHFSMRAGVDWTLYDGERKILILTFVYKFAFTNAGYFRYHFEKPSRGIDFYYQNTTKGNGFSLTAGIPIKLFETQKNKVTE